MMKLYEAILSNCICLMLFLAQLLQVDAIVFQERFNMPLTKQQELNSLSELANKININIGRFNEEQGPLVATNAKWLSTNELVDLIVYLNNQRRELKKQTINAVVIDTRNSNEYNGWKSFMNMNMDSSNNSTGLLSLYDYKNGHITFAHNLDADWLHLFDMSALNDLVIERLGFKIRQDESNLATTTKSADEKQEDMPVILYDSNQMRLEKVKAYLVNNFKINQIYMCKMSDLEIYDFFSNTNNTQASNLFFQEPFFDMLLSSDALYSIIRPFNQSYVINVNPLVDYKLIDVSQGGMTLHYERSHIPSALHLNTFDLEDANYVRKNRTELAKLFLEYGIVPNNTEMVILYGNPDPMAAYRAALIMKWMGVRDIHILNGGFRSWLIKNLPIETYPNKPIPIKNNLEENIKLFEEQSYLSQTPINYIVDYNYVSDIVKNNEQLSKNYVLVDVRTYEEFIGEKGGYLNVKEKGRLPNAFWGRSGSSFSQLEDYRNPDLTMRSGLELLKMWDDLGIDYKSKHLIFYCDNGWRSSEVLFYAELMGLYKISVYDRGFYDWTSNSNSSLQIGGPSNINAFKYEMTTMSTTQQVFSTPKIMMTSAIQFSSTPISIPTSSPMYSSPIISATSSIITAGFTTTASTSQAQTLTTSATTVSSSTRPFKPKATTNASDYYKYQFNLVTSKNVASIPNTSLLLNYFYFYNILLIFILFV